MVKLALVTSLCLLINATYGESNRNVDLLSPGTNAITSIETVNDFKSNIIIQIPSITLSDVVSNGVTYQSISVQDFSTTTELGSPEIPVLHFSLIVPPGTEPQFRVVKMNDTIIQNIVVLPRLNSGKIIPDHSIPPDVERNESIYSANAQYPSLIAVQKDAGIYRGDKIAFFEVYPIAFNPVSKELRVIKNLELEVIMVPGKLAKIAYGSYSGDEPMQIRYTSKKNSLQKTASSSSGKINDSDSTTDIIIITVPSLKASADTLALWHTMKGYETKIVTANSWTTTSVLDSVKYYYKKSTPAPNYLLIIGDVEQVPMKTMVDPDPIDPIAWCTAYLDYDYALMDGTSDKIPDLARGRIPANNLTEAYAAIRKIIRYEKTPPTTASFYSNALAATYFQPEQSGASSESRGYSFSKTIEDARQYLVSKSYSVTRADVAGPSVSPKKWWTSDNSSGSLIDIPAELQKPAFQWNATGTTVNNAFKNGIFLAYHYDHGEPDGWSDPSWKTSNIQFENKELLPVIYSINCLTGRLQHETKCFAEKLLLAESGGTVGIIAASSMTISTPNITMVKALMEVTWPGYVNDGRQESPVYSLGDILDKSFVRIRNLDDYHKRQYLFFGDPTTKMYTMQPVKISVTHNSTINPSIATFALSSLSINKGVATLVDRKTGTGYGKVQINGATANIPVKGTIPNNANIVLSIVNDNCITYQADLPIDGNTFTGIPGVVGNKSTCLKIGNLQTIRIEPTEVAIISIYDVLGKNVYRKKANSIKGEIIINDWQHAHGTYFVKIESPIYTHPLIINIVSSK